FRSLKQALGEELFTAFADDYLQVYPSESYTLGDLGGRFPQFLEETRPDRGLPAEQREDWPDFMIELARLEYDLLNIFEYKDINEYIYADNQTPDDQLYLTGNFHLYAFRFPVNQYFQAVQRGDNPPLPHAQQSFLAITRKNYQLGMFNLNPGQYHFLQFLKQHPMPIQQALTGFAKDKSVEEIKLTELWNTWRLKWLKNGFFCKK
ncbi:MAG TPA: putative DNA-binding domain-containing protein, partial [Bacteroidia bacterium]|nr:putative DNA-binding domain-containing protein [Bacteroidia bacterium]